MNCVELRPQVKTRLTVGRHSPPDLALTRLLKAGGGKVRIEEDGAVLEGALGRRTWNPQSRLAAYEISPDHCFTLRIAP